MNAGATSERVYDALKARILANGFRPGERLDANALGETLSSSVTPVRDALHILVGEGLVDTRTGDGFHLAMIDAPALEDLYAWNAQLLGVALSHAPKPPAPIALPDDGHAERSAALFLAIARRSANEEHRRAIAALNDRLHAVRVCEATRVPELAAALEELHALAGHADSRMLKAAVARYHRALRRGAADVVRALFRVG